jgi:hypothetical protein
MRHRNGTRKSAGATLVDLKKEFAKPRMAKSAKILQMNLENTRVPEHPRITIPGTVEKIIPAENPGQPEKADISIDEAPQANQAFRIENSLTDANGDEVGLKKGAHVDITVTDETPPRKRDS